MPRAWAASVSEIAAGAREILQDVVAMFVFGDVEAFDLAIGRACDDHRDLALERNEGLQNRGFGGQILPDPVQIVAFANDRLALAVIAEAAGFYDGGQADARNGGAQVCRRRHVGIVGGADSELFDKILFDQAILGGFQDFLLGQHRTARCEDHRGGCRHILEFVGDDIDIVGEQLQRFDVGIFRAGRIEHDIEGRRIRIR